MSILTQLNEDECVTTLFSIYWACKEQVLQNQKDFISTTPDADLEKTRGMVWAVISDAVIARFNKLAEQENITTIKELDRFYSEVKAWHPKITTIEEYEAAAMVQSALLHNLLIFREKLIKFESTPKMVGTNISKNNTKWGKSKISPNTLAELKGIIFTFQQMLIKIIETIIRLNMSSSLKQARCGNQKEVDINKGFLRFSAPPTATGSLPSKTPGGKSKQNPRLKPGY